MMKQYIVRRLLLAIVTLIGVSLLIFVIMRAIPGDVAISILGEILAIRAGRPGGRLQDAKTRIHVEADEAPQKDTVA